MDDPDMAIAEIEATQALNQRAKGDKTYHLIASFPSGERPTDAQLTVIEQRLCDAIGLGTHQRMSVVHGNTDNLHIHIAINKVHPQSLRLVTPFNDFYHLSCACRELEQQFRLQPDNGVGGERLSARAADLEAHQGVASFQRWVLGEPRGRLLAELERPDVSWAALQAAAAEFDLVLRPRGAGLVVASRSDAQLSVRGSQLDRRFSYQALAARLGAFAPDTARVPAKTQYRSEPLGGFAQARAMLWKAYEVARNERVERKKAASDQLSAQRAAAFKHVAQTQRQRRAAIMARRDLSGAKKRAAYSVLRVERTQAETALRAQFAEARAALHQTYAAQTWLEFLQGLAAGGDAVAVEALRRAKSVRRRPGHSYISGPALPSPALFSLSYRVHRNGDVGYFLDGERESFTDEGHRIRVADDASDAALQVALRVARVQFGGRLTLTGSAAFQTRAAALAGELGLDLRFDDAALEALRRRGLSHAKPEARDALTEYLAQRNATAQRVTDLPPHKLFSEADADPRDTWTYRGVRRLDDGRRVALLEQSGVMYVRPVSASEAARLAKGRVGTMLNARQFSKDKERD